MAERRGIGQALALTPDKMAFIKGGMAAAPSPVAESPTLAAPAAEETKTSTSSTADNVASADEPAPRTRRPRPSTPKQSIATDSASTNFNGQLLVPITTRLRPTTANALRRACLEMKLRGEQPNCQQDISEIAIAAWLADNGFL